MGGFDELTLRNVECIEEGLVIENKWKNKPIWSLASQIAFSTFLVLKTIAQIFY